MIATAALPSPSWNETETLALRAALSVIDAWDGDLSALLEIDSDSSSNSDSSRQAKKPTTTPYKPRRGARKQEIMALRAEAQKLQYIVALGNALVGSKHPGVEAGAWERLANTQKQRRVTAELQNAKLRTILQSQVNYARKMARVSRQVDLLKQALYVPPFPSFVDYKGPSIDPITQLRSLDALIPRASKIFSSGEFARHSLSSFHRTQFLSSTHAKDGADMENQSTWMFPAEAQLVANAMWVQIMRPAKHDKNSMDIYEDMNALVSQSMSTACLDEDFGLMQAQVAARMLPPDLGDGSILVVAKMAGLSFVGSQVKVQVSFDGWIRIEPVPVPASSNSGPTSVVRRYFRMLMEPPPDAKLTDSERRTWTQAVKASPMQQKFTKDLEKTMQDIESMLLATKAPSLVPSPSKTVPVTAPIVV